MAIAFQFRSKLQHLVQVVVVGADDLVHRRALCEIGAKLEPRGFNDFGDDVHLQVRDEMIEVLECHRVELA